MVKKPTQETIHAICRLFVLPIYQKLGYGTRLMRFAEEKISDYASSISLDSSLPAKNMYIKRGYILKSANTIKMENGDVLCYDVMEKSISRITSRINYDGKTFTTKTNSAKGEVSSQTIFNYHQSGSMIWVDYAGGQIAKGYLIGTTDQNGNLDFYYQHLNNDMELRIGKCKSNPIILENEKIELQGKWQWLNGDKSAGESTLVEI